MRRWLALAVLTLAVMNLSIDSTVLALAVPSITADLDPTATQVLWIGDIYSFVLAGLLVTMGNLADRIGRKRLLLIGSVCYGIASVAGAFAPTPEALIAARAVLGIAGATIMPSTLAIVRNLFDQPGERTRAVAIWSAGVTAGAAIGPLVGGALLESFWWGSVFLINVPVILLLLAAGVVLLPESRDLARPRVDLASALLSILTVVPVVYGIKHWVGVGIDVSVPAAVVVGLVSGVVFVRRQRTLTTPLIDLSLFKIPAFSGAVAANGLAIFAFVGLFFFFSQYLQLVRGLSPLHAGLVGLPAALASMLVVAAATVALRALGRGPAIATGLVVASAGFALLALAEGSDGVVWLMVPLGVIGLGVGLAMTLTTDAVVSAAPKSRAGSAAAIAETAFEMGAALGIAVLGSAMTRSYRSNLPALDDLDAVTAADVQQSLATASRNQSVTPDVLESAQEAFTSAMQTTSVVTASLLLVAALVAWRAIPARDTTVGSETVAASH